MKTGSRYQCGDAILAGSSRPSAAAVARRRHVGVERHAAAAAREEPEVAREVTDEIEVRRHAGYVQLAVPFAADVNIRPVSIAW